MKRWLVVFIVLGVLVRARMVAGDPEDISVSFRGKSIKIPAVIYNDERMFDLERLSRILGAVTTVSEDYLTVSWDFGGEVTEFTHGSPYYKMGRRTYSLPSSPFFDGGIFLVPLAFLTRDLPGLFPDIFTFDREDRVLRDIRDFAFLRGFKVDVGRTSTTITLLTTSPVKFALDNSRPGSFLLNLFRTRISSAIEDSIMQSGYVDSVQVVPYSDGAQLMFHLDPRAERYRVAEMTHPTGLRITFTGKSVDEAGVSVTAGIPEEELKTRDFSIESVMIDPGHGGKDPGAVAAGGRLMEKDVNLEVSKMLAEMLEAEGMEVHLTRNDDSFVPLSVRTRKANENGADIFVSIHCNSSTTKNLRGFEVYFLSEAKTDEERAVAHRENMSLKYERPDLDPATLGDIQFIFWDLAQNEFLTESYQCARSIVGEISNGLDIERSHVKQAGFYVLNGVYMPSILIELAYISNRKDRSLITDDEYLRKMVNHIFLGLTKYIESYNRKVNG